MVLLKKSSLFFVVLAALALNPMTVRALDGKVIILHSYHESFDWVQSINNALRSVLEPAGVDQRFFYMDAKRKPDEIQKKSAGRQARQLICEYLSDVVIAVDDNAQAYCVKDYVNKHGPQIVRNK